MVNIVRFFPILLFPLQIFASALSIRQQPLQDIVRWDNSSIIVHGERLMFLSAEFHPWRLPSPGLWLDIFQKIKAIGFSGVSFYLNWALLEGEPGLVRTDGVFSLDEFFSAAKEAGIYLIARPGPYINSEVSGGGFPGWLQRNKAQLRSTDPEFLNATKTYISHTGEIIAGAEITKGGPVILFQPDNEYSICEGARRIEDISNCLDREYMEFVENEYRKAGITVPFINNDVLVPLMNNDALALGNFRPGSGVGEVDIYGFDNYPMGWGQQPCSNPSNWTRGGIPLSVYTSVVRNISLPTSPRSIVEFQGGSPDKWGGVGVDKCAALVNHEFERIFNKVNYSLKVTLMNIYMTFGGTNWGNLGHPEGYTSYDIGAAIREDRTLTREKYSELKLQANFFHVSPAYLASSPLPESVGSYTDAKDIVTTPLIGEKTNFYIVRHADEQSFNSTPYLLHVRTSLGNITIPQLGGTLTLTSRDSKVHVVDYDIGGLNLIYSSAEIFTWAYRKYDGKRILLLYGGMGEQHEFALPSFLPAPTINSTQSRYKRTEQAHIVKWAVQEERIIVSFGEELDVYLLWRNDAYNYWVLDLPAAEPLGLYNSPSRHGMNASAASVILKAGYLLRSATISGPSLHLTGDLNRTTTIELISAPSLITTLTFNGKTLSTTVSPAGNFAAIVSYNPPPISLPDFSSLTWHYISSLPEIHQDYDDEKWTLCNLTHSNNPRNLTTPTSLYAGDYGYHSGSILYRGHFTATNSCNSITITTQGGLAYGHSIWLDTHFLGSFPGDAEQENHTQTLTFPVLLEEGTKHIITVLIDHMGYNLNFYANGNKFKSPRGILDYSLHSSTNHSLPQSAISWRMAGNLGGESYADKSRGPLNEGALFAERQGFHLPGALTNSSDWEIRSPMEGIEGAGVGFFTTSFDLDVPKGWDVPLELVLNGGKIENGTSFRMQIFVNGWQIGKYVSNLGPQTTYPIPEGTLNHNGPNTLALILWALKPEGTEVNMQLAYNNVIMSGYRRPRTVEGWRWEEREEAY
ncbi:glycoside hydrolase family 35 protein [Zopfia rhizophila CBS 207.26]|uniref:beta-galactosidase n=1 Tax=Zopfia rhizophila CBS 207.26 TaxID=1314779 RepID=A0A6A6DFB1_9PEZI|nr:glycoside hydrolase family 35 protein [Zopfia rhizophila CBS 207.26]